MTALVESTLELRSKPPLVAEESAWKDNDQLLPDSEYRFTPTNLYRPDVSGLRALALLGVVIFNTYPTALPSGFTGVDVFFVISGYLISRMLFGEFGTGRNTFAAFYSRRIRRIFPSLILVLSSTLWMGYLYLKAAQVKALAATMLASTLFCANMQLLLQEKTSFELDEANPLLHLWSLGVEEQFYIVWPFLASGIMKLPLRQGVLVQIVLLAASFLINVCFIGYHGHNRVSYYMPLSRFWQMSMGGLVAYFHRISPSCENISASEDTNIKPSRFTPLTLDDGYARNVLSISGFAAIIAGFVCMNQEQAFPGFWALLPTVGATLVIAAGKSGFVNYYVLSQPAAIYIGKISYCLYLWHWPLLVIAKLRYPNEHTKPFYMAPYMVLAVSFLLSVLTYEDVEKKIRRCKSKLVTPLLVFCMFISSVVALCVYYHPEVYSFTEIESAASKETLLSFAASESSTNIDPEVLNGTMSMIPSVQLSIPHNATVKSPQPGRDTFHFSISDAPKTMETLMRTQAPHNLAQNIGKSSTKKPHEKATLAKALKGSKDIHWDKGAGDSCPPNSPYMASIKLDVPFEYRGDRKVPRFAERCLILNPNQEKNGLVMVLGDSHADMSKPRFVKLYQDAAKANQSFPTVVFKTRSGRALLPCRPEYHETIKLLKSIKPQVVMFVVHYMQYLNPGAPKDRQYVRPPQCCSAEHVSCKEQNMDDVSDLLKQYQEDLKQLKNLGIKVFVVDQGPETYWQNPEHWIDGGKIKMPKAVLRSTWAAQYKWLYDPLHAAITGANATRIDYTDNYSDGDEVYMTNPDGWPIMSSTNHLSAHTAYHYLSVLDQVVDAARQTIKVNN